MKALLICPGDRSTVAALSEYVPLASIPILGKALVEYWLEDLAAKGAKEVWVLATDRPEHVRALVGDGARWGLRIEVMPEFRELTAAEARIKYHVQPDANWLPAPADAQVMEFLPGLPECPLFTSYAHWVAAQNVFLPRACTLDRLGVHEIKPGIWAGLHTHIAPDAELHAPCWIGDEVVIGAHAVIGPSAIVERHAVIEAHAVVARSIVGSDTFVGEGVELHHSIAAGNTLTSWKINSSIRVTERYLLCSLAQRDSDFKRVGVLSRAFAAMMLIATFPFALFPILRCLYRDWPVFRKQVAVRPRRSTNGPLPGDRVIYRELTNTRGWLRRWPQLWSVIRGDFGWIGNRPLSPQQAARLSNEFERLWLTAPLGLICLADAHGIYDAPSNDARAHASYYAVRASHRLNALIFTSAMFRFAFGFPYSRVRDAVARGIHSLPSSQRKAT